MLFQIQLMDQLQSQILYRGKADAIWTKKSVQYRFKNEKYAFSWKVYPQALIIDSISEVHVHLLLQPQKKTGGWIQTEFGKIDVSCYTHQYTVRDQRIEIQYELEMEAQNQKFHFVLDIKEAKHAVH